MAQIRPFAALRPRPDWAARICELPYDVISSTEAREAARDNPRSFLHVSKPEIDLPATVDVYDPQVYAKGRENFYMRFWRVLGWIAQASFLSGLALLLAFAIRNI